MTLRDLLVKSSYKKTFNQIYKLYLKGSRNKDQISKIDVLYYGFVEMLKTLPKSIGDLDGKGNKIYVTHTSGDEPVVDVCLFDKNKDELFALDFIDWNDIIDLEIYKTFQSSDEECLAHILHEITFWGFNKQTFEKQKKILKDSIDEGNR
tara:strand:- start:449 stop:898 length:450 start_codon:yes stop_codon:yes gene_type:complete